jgi:hypothetical protein
MKFAPLVENHKQRPKQQSPGICFFRCPYYQISNMFLNAKLLSHHRCLGREKLKTEVSMPVDYPVSRLKQDVRVMSSINTPIINMPNKARYHVPPIRPPPYPTYRPPSSLWCFTQSYGLALLPKYMSKL